MLNYIIKLYKQLKTLYYIKKYIDDSFDNSKSLNLQLESFELLKQLIFNSGSLYIKLFQWYISKLKSTIINVDSLDTIHIQKFINYFEDIFEQCPYHNLEHTKKIFKESTYGIALEDYVDINTLKPIASGSIGQVYYGVRLKDGIEVAIKVKHPNIESDLENQYELIKLFKFIQSIKYLRETYNLLFNIDDFLEDINLQCDFNNEANNTKTFIENFKDSSKYIIFPEPLYQSNDVLISRYIEGNSLDTLNDMQKYQTSLNFFCFFQQMLFVDNFIHGDLHCKNWKVRYDENKKITQIIIYDCGICFKNISSVSTSSFWLALVNFDIDNLLILLKIFIKESNNINIYNNNSNSTIKNVINDDTFTNEKFDTGVKLIFKDIVNQSMGTSIIMKSILNLFRTNKIIVNKFLLNFTILLCVIEEYMKSNNIINKKMNKDVSMFDIINDSQLDIIAFCDIKECYPKVKNILETHMVNNFKNYKSNIKNNNIENNNNENKKLFSSISLSQLTFKSPE